MHFRLSFQAYLFTYLIFFFMLIIRLSKPNHKRFAFWLTLTACLFYIRYFSLQNQSAKSNVRLRMLCILDVFYLLSFYLSLRSVLSFFATAIYFSSWALPTPVRFLKKAKPKTFVFISKNAHRFLRTVSFLCFDMDISTYL